MSPDNGDPAQLQRDKDRIRRSALARRTAQPNKDALSDRIGHSLAGLPEFRSAGTVLLYVHARAEVRTRSLLRRILPGGRRILVPYCVEGDLALFRLEWMDELGRGQYGIPEPKPELRSRPVKQAGPDEPDLIVVPGVAFDRCGGRLGYGYGYYDKLLQRVRPEAVSVGLAFECQLVEHIPVEPHDVRLEMIVTEHTVYRCRKEREHRAADPGG